MDGVDLADLVRPVEMPFAIAEGRAELAGKYFGRLWRHDRDLSRVLQHYLGEPGYLFRESTDLLSCECGEPGCWPLVCRIRANTNTVEWSDFAQPHRIGPRLQGAGRFQPHPGLWRYDSFGPFVFHRPQYEEAISTAVRGAD